ncbi:MAG: hypothetical protein PHU85_06955, partial [Phycisphaerae bacterium]|nr:hypothetical protein [Phycisphaerae bacterium]
GPGRGWLYVLVIESLFCLAPSMVCLGQGVDRWYLPLWMAGYIIVYVGFGNALARLFLRNQETRPGMLRWVLILVNLAMLFLLAMAPFMFMERGAEAPAALIGLNPFWAPGAIVSRPEVVGVAMVELIVLSAISLALNARLIVRDVAEQAGVYRAKRAGEAV